MRGGGLNTIFLMDKRFRQVRQHQLMLLPPDISELIPADAMVRVVDAVVDQLDRGLLDGLYPGGGRPSYDPLMMLKVVLYSYASGVYSSRKIAASTQRDLHVMWLCGMEPISHNTINRFRTARIGPVFEKIYAEIVGMLAERGFLDLSTYFLDGTKIEANAGRYTYTWAKASEKYRAALQEKIHSQLALIDELNVVEAQLAPGSPSEIDAQSVRVAAQRINDALAGETNPKDADRPGGTQEYKQVKRVLTRTRSLVERDWIPRLERYEKDREILSGRGSYSKTDTDATFMRMKDNPMGNGQLKAAYNIQAGCNRQYIIDVTVHQWAGDTSCTIDHLEHLHSLYGAFPGELVADAGYGSVQSYEYLDAQGITGYVKHSMSHKRQSKKWASDPFNTDNWPYNPLTDTYTCPAGRQLLFSHTTTRKSVAGYATQTRMYQATGCAQCPLRDKCVKNAATTACRSLQISEQTRRLRDRADFLLSTQRGIELAHRRGSEIETVWASIKKNMGFTRFTMRGITNVATEIRLVAMGHNLSKLHRQLSAST